MQATIQVEISGLEGQLLQNTRSWMAIERQKSVAYLTPRQVQRLHRAAFRQIRQALKPFGYYQVKITAQLDHIAEDRWLASYQIEAGVALRLTAAQIDIQGEGADHPALKRAVAHFPLRVGNVLLQETYLTGKSELLEKAQELGYLKAEYIQSTIEIYAQQQQSNLILILDTGPRFYLGPVQFFDSSLADSYLQKFIPFEVGDVYSDRALSAVQSELLDTGFFKEVEIRPQHNLIQLQQVPVEIYLTENPRTKYTLGVGYGTDTGARATARAQTQPVNRWGHRLNGLIQPAEWIRVWSLGYDIPLSDPLRQKLEFRWGWSHSNRDHNESERSVLSINHVGQRGRWRETRFLNIESEEYLIGIQPKRQAKGFIPGISWSTVRSNHPIWIERGRYNEITLRQSIPVLGFDTDATQLEFRNRWVTQAARNGRWITKLDLGATFIDDLSQLPLSQRFYAGGDDSVRGYSVNSLTPRNILDDRVGGKYLLVTSVEREFHWKGKWHYSVFLDSGNAMDKWDHALAHAVGFGIRRQSPIGPIRIDIANGMSEADLGGWRLHLSVGPEF